MRNCATPCTTPDGAKLVVWGDKCTSKTSADGDAPGAAATVVMNAAPRWEAPARCPIEDPLFNVLRGWLQNLPLRSNMDEKVFFRGFSLSEIVFSCRDDHVIFTTFFISQYG